MSNFYSKIHIANLALARLGQDTIASFEDDTKIANQLSAVYPVIKADLLSSSPWAFATVDELLVKVPKDSRKFVDFKYQYILPKGFLRFLKYRVGTDTSEFLNLDKDKYKVAEHHLYCNIDNIVLMYIKDVDIATYASSFGLALANMLSEWLMPQFGTFSEASRKLEMQKSRITEQRAKSQDSQTNRNTTGRKRQRYGYL